MESLFKVKMTALALNSLNNIRSYILFCSNDPDVADRVFGNIGRFIKNMSYNPFMGRVIDYDSVQGKNIRRITFDKKYNIFYQVDEQAQTVYILKITNGKQNVDRQLFGL